MNGLLSLPTTEYCPARKRNKLLTHEVQDYCMGLKVKVQPISGQGAMGRREPDGAGNVPYLGRGLVVAWVCTCVKIQQTAQLTGRMSSLDTNSISPVCIK